MRPRRQNSRSRSAVRLAMAAWLVSASVASAESLYRIDQRYGRIAFSVSTLGLFTTQGAFPRFEGELLLDTAYPERSHIDVIIDVTAIEMPLADQADLLRSAAYFDTATYPAGRFVSTSIETITPMHYLIHGLLQVRGRSQPQDLDAVLRDRHRDLERKIEVADFVVTGAMRRSAFGMVADRVMISDTVGLDIRIHLTVDVPADGG